MTIRNLPTPYLISCVVVYAFNISGNILLENVRGSTIGLETKLFTTEGSLLVVNSTFSNLLTSMEKEEGGRKEGGEGERERGREGEGEKERDRRRGTEGEGDREKG